MKVSFRKIVFFAVIAFFVLIAGAAAALYIMFPSEKIKAMVIPQVEKILDRKLSVDKAGITIFPMLGVSLDGVEIANTSRKSFSSDPFVKIERFKIEISVMSIIKRVPEITKVVISKPEILLEIDSSGAFNYDDMALMAKDTVTVKEEKKSRGVLALPVPVTLKLFKIENGSIIYRSRLAKQEIIIGSINESIGFSIDKQLKDIKTSGDLVLSSISLKTKEITKPLSNLSVTLSHDVNADLVNGNANVNKLRLSFQKVFLNLTGTVANLNGDPELDLKLNSDPIQIADILKEIPVELVPDIAKLYASGIAELGLIIKGTLTSGAPFPINGNCRLKDVTIKYTALPKAINSLNADCDFTDSSVSINSLKMNLGENPIALRASFVNFKNPFIDLAILAKLNLGDFKDLIELPKGAALSGNLAFDINAKGAVDASDPSKLDVNGKLDLGDLSVLWPPLVKPAVITGKLTLSSKAIGENLSVKIGHSSLTLNSAVTNYLSIVFADSSKTLPRPNIYFTLNSPLLDIDEFMPPSTESAPSKESSSAKKESTQQSAEVPLIAPLPGIDMKGTVSSKKIVYQKIEMDNLVMKVNVIKDIADIDINTGFARGTIKENIHADLRNTSDIKFTNKLNIDNVQISDLMGHFGGLIKPTNALTRELGNIQNSLIGKVSMQSVITGNGGTQQAITKTVAGDITARISDGKITNSAVLNNIASRIEKFVKIGDLDFRDMKAIMHIENEMVQFNDFKISSSLGDWDILGSTGFEGSLKVLLNDKLTKDVSSKLLSVQSSGKDMAKNLLKGTKFAGVASSLVDNVGIPSDNEGRVTIKINLGGTLTKPEASFAGFGEGTSKSSSAGAATAKQKVTEQVKQAITEKKEELKENIDEQKAKLEAEAKQNLEQEKAALEAQAKQKEEQLKNEAKKKLKGLF